MMSHKDVILFYLRKSLRDLSAEIIMESNKVKKEMLQTEVNALRDAIVFTETNLKENLK